MSDITNMNLGPCAKATVRCTIILPDGRRAIGENWCVNPQKVCPREPGEGYEKCKSICGQLGHAETEALRIANTMGGSRGGHAYIEGHDHACKDCQRALFAEGVVAISIGAPSDDQSVDQLKYTLAVANGLINFWMDLATSYQQQRDSNLALAREKAVIAGDLLSKNRKLKAALQRIKKYQSWAMPDLYSQPACDSMVSEINQIADKALAAVEGASLTRTKEDVCSLLQWASEAIMKIECHESPDITGEVSEHWEVTDNEGRKSYGPTMIRAIQDAQMSDDDPRRCDYIPPEYRTENIAAVEGGKQWPPPCPHCSEQLLTSEDRGLHCDGCDDLTAEDEDAIIQAAVEGGIQPTRAADDSELIDYLATLWNSQGKGHIIMGHWFNNVSGSFRDAIRSQIDSEQEIKDTTMEEFSDEEECHEAVEAANKVPVEQIKDAIRWTTSYLHTLNSRATTEGGPQLDPEIPKDFYEAIDDYRNGRGSEMTDEKMAADKDTSMEGEEENLYPKPTAEAIEAARKKLADWFGPLKEQRNDEGDAE